jgi:hypothetical protein
MRHDQERDRHCPSLLREWGRLALRHWEVASAHVERMVDTERREQPITQL